MSSSETATHQFIDPNITHAGVDMEGDLYLCLTHSYDVCLSKEDLLHLLKLIEES